MWRPLAEDLSLWMVLGPAVLQAAVMMVDELCFHRRRGLGSFERIGHPIDTLSVAACYLVLVLHTPENPRALPLYLGLAMLSCALITKDEWIHRRQCTSGECFLHALLFMLHPIVLFAFGLAFVFERHMPIVRAALFATLAFAFYQLAYWSLPWTWHRRRPAPEAPTTTSTGR